MGRSVRRQVQRRRVARVLRQEDVDLLEREPGIDQRLVELGLRRLLGLEQVHLHAALEVDGAVAARLHRAEDGARGTAR